MPQCSAPLTVPRIPTNPYLRPINNVVRQMKTVPFPFPYIPQIVQLSVLTSVLLLFAGLFVTIGLVSQIAGVFRGLILDAQKHLREGSAVERSAQAVSMEFFRFCSFLSGWFSCHSRLLARSGVRIDWAHWVPRPFF